MINALEMKGNNLTDLDFTNDLILQFLSFNAIDDQRRKHLYWEILVEN